tara:strand:- start:14597 stop:14872 length:276 start_codon:yes stop_codon:yes gene_type:complete
MEQLDLKSNELDSIGFERMICKSDEMNPARDIFKINTINGYFYYNPSQDVYKWYHKTIIGETANDVHLDITKKAELFVILQSFKCEFSLMF